MSVYVRSLCNNIDVADISLSLFFKSQISLGGWKQLIDWWMDRKLFWVIVQAKMSNIHSFSLSKVRIFFFSWVLDLT